jgi:hypothetical protein
MKTPREILFGRHQAIELKLDTIRQSTVAAVCDRRASTNAAHERRSQTAATTALLTLWRELFFPCRRIWTGLAAVWILIFTVNFSLRDDTGGGAGKTVQSVEIIMSLQAQQRWMNELFADRLTPPDADRPRNFTPKPRSEKFQTATV